MLNPSKIKQLLALIIVLATLALAAAIALKAYRGMGSRPHLPSLPKNIDVSLQKIHYTETKDGVKKWELVADKAEYDKAGEIVRLSGVRLDVAATGKNQGVVLTAARAEYNTRSKDVELIGDISAKSPSGLAFTTGRIAYVASRSILRTADRVRLSDRNFTVEGVGMELVVGSKTVKIMSQVEASYTPGAVRP